jgi:hypothetical protein
MSSAGSSHLDNRPNVFAQMSRTFCLLTQLTSVLRFWLLYNNVCLARWMVANFPSKGPQNDGWPYQQQMGNFVLYSREWVKYAFCSNNITTNKILTTELVNPGDCGATFSICLTFMSCKLLLARTSSDYACLEYLNTRFLLNIRRSSVVLAAWNSCEQRTYVRTSQTFP